MPQSPPLPHSPRCRVRRGQTAPTALRRAARTAGRPTSAPRRPLSPGRALPPPSRTPTTTQPPHARADPPAVRRIRSRGAPYLGAETRHPGSAARTRTPCATPMATPAARALRRSPLGSAGCRCRASSPTSWPTRLPGHLPAAHGPATRLWSTPPRSVAKSGPSHCRIVHRAAAETPPTSPAGPPERRAGYRCRQVG